MGDGSFLTDESRGTFNLFPYFSGV